MTRVQLVLAIWEMMDAGVSEKEIILQNRQRICELFMNFNRNRITEILIDDSAARKVLHGFFSFLKNVKFLGGYVKQQYIETLRYEDDWQLQGKPAMKITRSRVLKFMQLVVEFQREDLTK